LFTENKKIEGRSEVAARQEEGRLGFMWLLRRGLKGRREQVRRGAVVVVGGGPQGHAIIVEVEDDKGKR
jgi:hypothetical protein